MSDTFKTIYSATEGLFKDKGSKFISFAIPNDNTNAIKEVLNEYKKKYFDARHVCYAYMLGHERTTFRANDDGEPSGTAGRTILGQINSYQLTNVLIIVVRYFGGILLGTGGLVNAYKHAAADALEQADILEKTVDSTLNIEFDYILMNDVMRVIKELSPTILSQNFENDCCMLISIRNQNFNALQTKLSEIIGLKILLSDS